MAKAATTARGKRVTTPAGKRATGAAAAPPAERGTVTAKNAADHEGVRQVLAHYCAFIDQGQVEALSELFLPTGELVVSFADGPPTRGRAAIAAWYREFFRGWPKASHARHKIFEPCLRVDGATATASTYFDSDFVEGSGRVTILAGRYEDQLVKQRGRWFFAQRTITITHHYSPGKATEGMKRYRARR